MAEKKDLNSNNSHRDGADESTSQQEFSDFMSETLSPRERKGNDLENVDGQEGLGGGREGDKPQGLEIKRSKDFNLQNIFGEDSEDQDSLVSREDEGYDPSFQSGLSVQSSMQKANDSSSGEDAPQDDDLLGDESGGFDIKQMLEEQKSLYKQKDTKPLKPKRESRQDDEEEFEPLEGHEVESEPEEEVVEVRSEIVSKEQEEIEKVGKEEFSRLPIGQKLIMKNLITPDQLDIALKIQRESKKNMMIGQVLVEMGILTENTLGEILAEESGVKRFDIRKTIIDPSLIKQVPKEIAIRYKSIPVLLEDGQIYVAMTDVYNVLSLDRIRRYFPKRFTLTPIHASERDLNEVINNYYDYELSIDGILKEMEGLSDEDAKELLQKADTQDGYVNPTVRLIDALLIDAIQKGASDLHFEPEEKFIRLRYRVDGRLRLVRSFHKDYWQAIVVRIKILSDMNITESRRPQDGRIVMNILGREISFRVATQPTIQGENLVLRVLDKQKALLPLDALGFSEQNVKTLHKSIKRPEGIIIVTGPTGSGKSTTLYSILSYINKMEVNIMTLEDPVEYSLPYNSSIQCSGRCWDGLCVRCKIAFTSGP
jgi:hypothetical protein